jgi:LEA14-like dessication related protein
MADNEDKEVVALEQNVGKVTIEDRGSDKPERENKDEGGVMGFIKDVGEAITGIFSWGKPDADIAGFNIPVLNTKRAEIIIDVLITNPNPIPIPLVDMIYEISSDGRKLCSGTIPDAGTVHAHGKETVKIPLTLIYKDIVDTFDDIEPGQILPYLAKVTMLIDVPVIGRITIPLEKEGEIPIPHKPDVDLDKIDWDHLSLEETSATLHLTLKNLNKFDIGINSFEYDLQIADVSIGKASLKESTEVKGEGVGKLQVPITFRPKDFGGALWDIMRGRGTGYTMVGAINVDTPFGPMHLPFSKTSETTLKGKDDEDE